MSSRSKEGAQEGGAGDEAEGGRGEFMLICVSSAIRSVACASFPAERASRSLAASVARGG